jgi:hypothetical protein
MSPLSRTRRRHRPGALVVALTLGGLVLAPSAAVAAPTPGPSDAPTTTASTTSQDPAAQATAAPSPADDGQPAPTPTPSPADVEAPAPAPTVSPTAPAAGPQQRSAAPQAPAAASVQAVSSPNPPSAVTVSSVGVDRFTIGWTAPAAGATPTGYHVYVWEQLWQGTPAVDLVVDAGTRSVAATGLKRGTQYAVEVVTVAGAALSAGTTEYATTVLSDHRPVGALDSAVVVPGGQGVRVVGWALDVDTAGPLEVEVRVDDGTFPIDVVVANANRPDVGAAYPGSGSLHGVDYAWSWATPSRLSVGTHKVCLVAREPGEPWQLGTTNVGCANVTIKPARPTVGNFESLTRSGSDVVLRGWALEPSGGEDVAIIVRADDDLDTNTVTAYLDTDVVRGDVAAAYPGTGNLHGFTATLAADPGEHVVCLWGLQPFDYSAERERPLGCRTLGVDPTIPVGNFESLASTVRGLSFSGWAVDPQVAGPIDVDVYLDDVWAGTVSTTTPRADVGRVYPGTGNLHGYSGSVPAATGIHEVCLSAYDETYDLDIDLGCRTVTVAPPANRMPQGNFESLTVSGSTVTLSGWAMDPDVVGPIDVHFYVNGNWGGLISTTGIRTDVGAFYPGTGDQHGFSRSFTAGPGTHQICAYAIDATSGANLPMGCRYVTVVNKNPLGNFESLTVSGSTVTLSGWAMDPDVVGPIDVHFYVNGNWGGVISTTGIRSDVARAYPGTGDQHGFSRSFVAGPGTHKICAYAIDTATKANADMGCRYVTVR